MDTTNTNTENTNTAQVDISSANHPARIFIAEAEKHVGDGGHAWVQSQVGIGNLAWCAATCCAVGKACGYNGVIMPDNIFTASGFGQSIVEDYGGEYLPGPMMGGSSTPQVGDIIEFYKGYATSGTFGIGTRYAAYHVGMVRYCEGNIVYTVEGNSSSTYKFVERSLDAGNIGWYARPDWTKVGGTATVGTGSALFTGTKLYETLSSNADATIREVAYFGDDGKPSISSTGTKLSVINYTTFLAYLVAMFGSSSASSSGTPDNIDALDPVPREIVQFLIGKGLCTAAAIGVIGNIQTESGFDTSAVGDYGTSFGLCQWHNERGTAMKNMAGSNWASNLSGQLDYLWTELNGAYNASVLIPLQNVSNTLEGAQSSAEIWCRKFEVPDNVDNEVVKRKANAKAFWEQVIVADTNNTNISVNINTDVQTSTTTAQGTIVRQDGTKVTTGSTVTIPTSVNQSGIIANYTGYDRNWAKNTVQRSLYDVWVSQGKPSQYNIATISGYYLIAVANTFGTTGDIVSVVLADGTYFNAILGDAKNPNDPLADTYGHHMGTRSGQIDVVEWESVASTQNDLRNSLSNAGWLGKKVDHITNYGPWLTGART